MLLLELESCFSLEIWTRLAFRSFSHVFKLCSNKEIASAASSDASIEVDVALIGRELFLLRLGCSESESIDDLVFKNSFDSSTLESLASVSLSSDSDA